jgi:hypothetical protein
MTSESDVRKKLKDFLEKQISLETFNDWLAPIVWDAKGLDPTTKELVYSIELFIAEYSSGHRTGEDLRSELGKL